MSCQAQHVGLLSASPRSKTHVARSRDSWSVLAAFRHYDGCLQGSWAMEKPTGLCLGVVRFRYEMLAVGSASQRTPCTSLLRTIRSTLASHVSFSLQPSLVFREVARDSSKIIPMTQLVLRLFLWFHDLFRHMLAPLLPSHPAPRILQS